MAKITVNVDTELKTLEVLVNGELQQNVREVYFHIYDGYRQGEIEISSNISMVERNEETGITKVTNLIAKDSQAGRDALASGAWFNNKFDDLVETVGLDKINQDIMNYFSRQ